MNQITNVCGGPCKVSTRVVNSNYPQVFVGNTRNPFARGAWLVNISCLPIVPTQRARESRVSRRHVPPAHSCTSLQRRLWLCAHGATRSTDAGKWNQP